MSEEKNNDKNFLNDIPSDMLSFWKTCCMVYSLDNVSDSLLDKIKKDSGYEKDYVDKLHKWVKRLPQVVISECLIVPRFDAFCTYVTKMLLRDITKVGLARLKEKISGLDDVNALAATSSTIIRRVAELNKQYATELEASIGTKDEVMKDFEQFRPVRVVEDAV